MKLTKEQQLSAATQYAKDNELPDAIVVQSETGFDLDLDVQYTRSMWDDGVPVTKMFSQNKEIDLHIPQGTELIGITYRGLASGRQRVDFYYGRMWYSCDDEDLITALALERFDDE